MDTQTSSPVGMPASPAGGESDMSGGKKVGTIVGVLVLLIAGGVVGYMLGNGGSEPVAQPTASVSSVPFNSAESIEARIKRAVNESLPTLGAPAGSQLLSVKLDVAGDVATLTLNFNSNFTFDSMGAFEDVFSGVSNIAHPFVQGTGIDAKYSILEIILLVDGKVYPPTSTGASSTPRVVSPTPQVSQSANAVITEVYLPLISTSKEDSVASVGCGEYVVYGKFIILPTTVGPLTATYQKLFAGDQERITKWMEYLYEGSDFTHEIANQTNLKFDRVTVANGVAKVYLTGSLISNECADPRVQAQIEYAAKYFKTVQRVETYLNGKLFDWQAWMNQKD